jgi:hypothetical protein
MALSGVEALKIARYFLQFGRERLVERSEVVKAKDVGAFLQINQAHGICNSLEGLIPL